MNRTPQEWIKRKEEVVDELIKRLNKLEPEGEWRIRNNGDYPKIYSGIYSGSNRIAMILVCNKPSGVKVNIDLVRDINSKMIFRCKTYEEYGHTPPIDIVLAVKAIRSAREKTIATELSLQEVRQSQKDSRTKLTELEEKLGGSFNCYVAACPNSIVIQSLTIPYEDVETFALLIQKGYLSIIKEG